LAPAEAELDEKLHQLLQIATEERIDLIALLESLEDPPEES